MLKNIILYPIGFVIILLLIPYVAILLICHHLLDDTKKDWVKLSEWGRAQQGNKK